MPAAYERFQYQHVAETLVLSASACCCMSALHAFFPIGWPAYIIGSIIVATAILVPLRFARMLAPAPYGRSTDPKVVGKKKILSVLGTGGHTREMMLLLQHLDRRLYAPVTYVYTSDFCRRTVGKDEQGRGRKARFRWIPRSRAVKQGWVSTVFTTLASLPRSFWIVLTEFPDVLIVNGPGVCIPVAAAAVFLNIFVGKVRCLCYCLPS